MYSLQIRKHLNIFFEKEKDQSFLEKAKTTVSGIAEAMSSDIVDKLKISVDNAKKSSKQSTKDTLKILEATWALVDFGMFDIKNRLQLAKRWWEWSGKIWAQKIIEALDKAEKWEKQIVTYSNNKYESWSLKEYENDIKNTTGSMNVSAMKWLYSLRWTGIGFEEKTWEKIGLYVFSRNWDTRLLSEIPQAKEPLMKLWKKIKEDQEKKFTEITNPIIQQLQLENPKIAQLLTNTSLKLTADGKGIDASAIIAEFEKNGEKLTIKQIEEKFKELAETLKRNWEALIKESKDQLKRIPGNPKTLREVGIRNIPYTQDGKTIDISGDLIANCDPKRAREMIIAIEKFQKTLDKSSKDFNEKNKVLESIKWVLVGIGEWKKLIWHSGETALVASEAKKHREKWWTRETFVEPKVEFLQTANTLATARAQQESTRSDLKEYNINTLEQAEKRLAELVELWNKKPLNEKDDYLKKLLEQFIRDNIAIAREQQIAEKTLGKAQAREIFTQTNQFISGNPTEKYDFKALEKIATLTDPESTPWQKNLARMEPGQSISMSKFMEWEMSESSIRSSSEISSIDISMSPDGTYNIPLLKEKNLTKPQVQEYISNISLYANIGLSQFIPHIPLITEQLRKKWINTSMDGNTGTGEQQKVLKEVYTLLFGKKLETSSLWDVERAFSSSLWNPENMKNAMQHTLKVHKLISESSQPIAADTLKRWIQSSNEWIPTSIDPLTNI